MLYVIELSSDCPGRKLCMSMLTCRERERDVGCVVGKNLQKKVLTMHGEVVKC